MESSSQESKKAMLQAGALFGRFIMSQVVGVAMAFVAVFLEAGVLRWVITWMSPDCIEKARALTRSGFSTHPWFVGPVLYGLIFSSALSAAALCQYMFLWASPRWREMVYNRNRPVPPKNIREAVGARWTVFCWILPISIVTAPAFLWWVVR